MLGARPASVENFRTKVVMSVSILSLALMYRNAFRSESSAGGTDRVFVARVGSHFGFVGAF